MKKSAKFSLLGLAVILGIAGTSTFQRTLNEKRLSLCNNGEIESCEEIEHLDYWKEQITNDEWKKNKAIKANNRRVKGCLNDNSSSQRYNCQDVDFALITKDQRAKVKEKYDLLIDSDGKPKDWTISSVKKLRERENDPIYQAEQRSEAEKEELKAEGWYEQKPGIFVKWCKNASYRYPKKGDCPMTEAYLDRVSRMMVWCRDKSCGNIYAKVNFIQGEGGPVVGWTNDTAYGDYGQKVILTFQTNARGGVTSLVEFRTY